MRTPMWWIMSIAVAVRLRQRTTDLFRSPTSKDVRQQIFRDTSTLGEVAKNLLSAQNAINRVEKEVMRKVFDLQKTREFFTTHQALEVERDGLAKRIEELQRTVTDSLLGVQNDINRVEKEVTGKVFDLEEVREFFSTHQALQAERDELAKNSKELQHTVAHLSDQIAQDKAQAAAQATAQEKKAARKLAHEASQISDLQDRIKTMEEELARSDEKRKNAEADKAQLARQNEVLRDKLAAATAKAEKLEHESQETYKTLQDNTAEIRKLTEEVIKQHNYGEACHLQAAQMEQRFGAQLKHEKAEHAATKAAADQAQAATAATQQRLLADKQLLEQQIAKQQTVEQSQAAQVASLTQQVAKANAALTAAQEKATVEVQQLKFSQGALQTQLKTCDDSLMQNVNARNKEAKSDHALKIKKLSAELMKQHAYGEMCHSQVVQLEQRFAAQMQREKAELAATKAAADHAKAAAAPVQQRLLADKQLFEEQLAKQQSIAQNQAAHVTALGRQLANAKAALAAAADKARKEVQQLKFYEGSLRTQLKTCDDSLMQNVDARNMADKQLHECKQKLLGGKEQILEMQLGQCTDFKKEVSTSLSAAQVKLATCTADKDQAINARKAGEEQLKIIKESARKTTEEAQAQVVAKTKEAAKYQEEAQKAIMAAEAQLSAKCGVVWKKKNKKVTKRLKECKVAKEDLRMAEAQTLTLEQSLKACMQTQ